MDIYFFRNIYNNSIFTNSEFERNSCTHRTSKIPLPSVQEMYIYTTFFNTDARSSAHILSIILHRVNRTFPFQSPFQERTAIDDTCKFRVTPRNPVESVSKASR